MRLKEWFTNLKKTMVSLVNKIEYKTKYLKFYKEDNAMHYLRLRSLQGTTKQKIMDIKKYLTDNHSNASMFKLYSTYDVSNQYGCLNELVRNLFSEICHGTIIFNEALEEPYCNENDFNDIAASNSYYDILVQLDKIIEKIDDNIIIPKLNYKIVYTFYNYDLFYFGSYEDEEKHARM